MLNQDFKSWSDIRVENQLDWYGALYFWMIYQLVLLDINVKNMKD